MSLYLSLAGLMAIAIFTPGPNNLLALSATSAGRFTDGLPIMFGVVVGMTVVFGLLLVGFTTLGAATATILPIIAVAGSAYMAWLGFSLMMSKPEAALEAHSNTAIPPWHGVALFQLANPKSLVMLSTVLSGAQAGAATGAEVSHPLLLITMNVLIIGAIATWSLLGASLSKLLQTPQRMRIANAVMGGMLMVFAVDILLGQIS